MRFASDGDARRVMTAINPRWCGAVLADAALCAVLVPIAYHAMGVHAGRPSLVQACLKSQSKQVQKSVHEAQNFVKHGRKNLKGAVSFRMKFAEVLMIDSVDCHQKLFGTQTPIMNAYFTRFMFENPQVVRAEHRASFLKGVDVYNIHKIPRGE